MILIGYYKDWVLVKRDEFYYVVNKTDRKILFKGTSEEIASKYFGMLIGGFINEKGELV